MIQYIEDVFFKGSNPICQPLFPSQHLTNRVVKLEKGKNYVYSTQGLNPSDENSCLVHYIQVQEIFLEKKRKEYNDLIKCFGCWYTCSMLRLYSL